jgi:predicted nucleic acid-binding protein
MSKSAEPPRGGSGAHHATAQERGITRVAVNGLERIVQTFQICDLDAASSRIWAKLMQKTTDDHALDAMIAATAIARDMTVATRNVRHFKSLGAAVINPFAAT